MNCCDANGNCTQGIGCPVRPLLITDEGPEEVDTRSIFREALVDLVWVVIGMLVMAIVVIATTVYLYNHPRLLAWLWGG